MEIFHTIIRIALHQRNAPASLFFISSISCFKPIRTVSEAFGDHSREML